MDNTKKNIYSGDDDDLLMQEIYKYLGEDLEINLKTLMENKKVQFGISSDRQLSQIIGIDRNTIGRILNGEVQKVDILSILKINQFLGIPLNRLIQIYVASMQSGSVAELEAVRKKTFIIENFDLNSLKKIGFIETTTDFDQIEHRICSFFGLESLFQFKQEIGNVLFSRTKNASDDKIREFWVRCAFTQFERINNPNNFEATLVEKFATKIRLHTRQEETGLITVLRALYSLGVTVIVQSYLSKIQIRGATFSVNGKPCIVITDYRKSYDTLWFSLMHELAHVIYDFEDIKSMKYHLTGGIPDLFITEEQEGVADYFARQLLVSDDKLNYILPFIDTPTIVNDYAKKIGVHPALIYGFYCWDQSSRDREIYAKYASYIPKSTQAVRLMKSNPWEKTNLFEQVEYIKAQLQNF
ncbi:MAG: XRE family transcriptional regulator [Bacteroidia bacterium]